MKINNYGQLGVIGVIFFFCTIKSFASEGYYESVVSHLEKQLPLNKGELLAVRKVTETDWTRLFIFGPYTTPEIIFKTVGKKLKDKAVDRLAENDTINLLVFIEKNESLHLVVVPRQSVDFSPELHNRKFDPTTAVFKVTVDKSGFYLLTGNN